MTRNARELRNAPTAEERLIWQRLHDHRPRFTRQLTIGRYIIDLACRTRKIAIEFDGSQHLAASAYDAERTRFLESLGWTMLRFWNSEVRDNPDGVAEAIVAVVASAPYPPTPDPSLPGRGVV